MQTKSQIKVGDLVRVTNISFIRYWYTGADVYGSDPYGIVTFIEGIPKNEPTDKELLVYSVSLMNGTSWSFYGGEIEVINLREKGDTSR